MGMLSVVTGIVFVLLLLSLLATTVMELLAATLSLRGKNLEEALRNMLAGTDVDEKNSESVQKQFFVPATVGALRQKPGKPVLPER